MCDGEICELVTHQQQQQQQQQEAGLAEHQAAGAHQQQQPQRQRKTPPLDADALKLPAATVTAATAEFEPVDSQSPASPSYLGQVGQWQVQDVVSWLEGSGQFSWDIIVCLEAEGIDGKVLLTLTEEDVRDMRYKLGYKLTFGELKKFWLEVCQLQALVKDFCERHAEECQGLGKKLQAYHPAPDAVFVPYVSAGAALNPSCPCPPECPSYVGDCETYRLNGKAANIAPEYFKTAISLGYSFLVTWITSFVMVIVHERVPDMKRYPPLPDIFLDNVPHIPWAFNMCEITGSLLFTIWLIVLTFHKYRMVLLRRFFALAGTVFLLRCVTMLITSLSVPGMHLQCNQKDFAIDDQNLKLLDAMLIRMTRAYNIWSGLGMSIQGVRTCGDYMFSGHTVALTLLNFFITEYTPRNLYFLHTLTWLLNMFGIFFILAAHEHYSIDVFVAFYITSRLFLYYHTLANNRALMQSDSTRTRIWFPMFSYFESSVEDIIPNEFDTPGSLVDSLFFQVVHLKDTMVVAVQQLWLQVPVSPRVAAASMRLFSASSSPNRCRNTHSTASAYFTPHQSVTSGINSGAGGGGGSLASSSPPSPGLTFHQRPRRASSPTKNQTQAQAQTQTQQRREKYESSDSAPTYSSINSNSNRHSYGHSPQRQEKKML